MKKQISQLPSWIVSTHFLYLVVFLLLPIACLAQVVTGSNGSDGAFNPTATNTIINMADHPNGVYQYTSVNIPSSVTVTFTPNANNTPVVWLVQNSVVINGTVDVSGQAANGSQGGIGGPGGWAGGSGGVLGTPGQGPGGGTTSAGGNFSGQYNYGNAFLVPLLGGSGGGGTVSGGNGGGGGGGGAILIAASGTITLKGYITSDGGNGGGNWYGTSGGGSGGAVRLVASQITGSGWLNTVGGNGMIRFDAYQNAYSGGANGTMSQGSQFIIIPSAGQLPQLTVISVAGVPVSASPTGELVTPDAVLSAQQNNPIPFVVSCANLPLNTQITVNVKPANGSPISAVGYNNTGTQASSTATVSLNIPRGGGLIYATAATGN
jgi:hypothetical protein